MELTPLLKQYQKIKRDYSKELLFFRMGDFYELFYEDAKIAAKELGIALTSKPFGKNLRVPLAGVPVKAAEGYIKELLKKGYTIAICEQVEEGKDLMLREVVEVITPGTITLPSLLSPDQNIYILSLYPSNKKTFGIAYTDITTFELRSGILEGESLHNFLLSLKPKEILAPHEFSLDGFFLSNFDETLYSVESAEERIKNFFGIKSLDGFGIKKDVNLIALSHLLDYLTLKKKTGLENLRLKPLEESEFLILDATTVKNLELVDKIHPESQSLYETLNFTKTALGSRFFKKNLLFPLKDKEKIKERHQAVEEIIEKPYLRKTISEILEDFVDFERVLSRVARLKASPSEVYKLSQNFIDLFKLKEALNTANSKILREISGNLHDLRDLAQLIFSYLKENPSYPGDGNCIKRGVSAELDELIEIKINSSQKLKELEEKEKRATGIPNLRIKYNQVFGFFIEITKSYIDRVPEYYERKQTLTNSERFITEELKSLEVKILSAEDRIKEIETFLYEELLKKIMEEKEKILDISENIALLDLLLSFSESAIKFKYVKPEISEEKEIVLKNSRHPVVEQRVKEFIPNDVLITPDNFFQIITGPNMGGKSTYIRQVALCTILAQIGSFIPAEEGKIGIVDRIFTRIGSSDDLARGISTFYSEMLEVSQILNNATERSLILLDEIGRGTSTYDGLSIAWAVSEDIIKRIKARTLFATHYHELTSLKDNYQVVKNLYTLVKEWKGEVIFLRKIIEGSMDRSYGIYVAKLAGIPKHVIERAREILINFENKRKVLKFNKKQLELFEKPDPLRDFIEKVNPDELSPRDALELIYKLKKLQ
ncbi:MAG: DNA mismatch repair protein MutS [Candidatus Hydrothermales bacterium]